MKVLFLHGLESKPGGTKALHLEKLGHVVFNPALPKEDFTESVQIAQRIVDKENPAVIVGSSRGGAVAMALKAPNARMVLLAPAWKKFNVDPDFINDAVIMHCELDDIVDIDDSFEILRCGIEIKICGYDHRMSDPETLTILGNIVNSI